MRVRREPSDRLLVELIGVIAIAEQRAQAGLDPERPVGAGGASRLLHPLERTPGTLRLAAPNGRLDQLGQRPDRRPFGVEALGGKDRGQRGLVAAEPVVQASAQKLGGRQGDPLPASLRLADRGSDQLREFGLATAQGGEPQPRDRVSGNPGRFTCRSVLLLEERCCSQLAKERVDRGAGTESKRQRGERTRLRARARAVV